MDVQKWEANAWKKVEGIMMDRNISRKPKGKILDSTRSSIYGLKMVAMSELQQHMREQLDKENSRCKESGEMETEIHQRRSWN